MRRLLVISNGIGEDSVGAEIVRRFPRTLVADAYPTLGEGRAYRNACPVVGPRARLPSEGSRVRRGTIVRDILGGLPRAIGPALRFLRSARTTYDGFLVIGDFIGVGACWLSGIRDVVYLDVYHTGYGRDYFFIERQIMKRTCATVFCRSPRLARTLQAIGIDARAAGNVMMDTIPSSDYDAGRRRLRLKAVTLLPGSRDATVANFALQIEALAMLPDELKPDVFVAVADGIDPMAMAAAAGLVFHGPGGRERADVGRLSGRGLHVHFARGALRQLVEESDVVLSQAGTATIQALGLGRPVITFVRSTDRRKRFIEENRFFDNARVLVEAEPADLSRAVQRLLEDDAEVERLGAIGRERVGGPGVIAEIIGVLEQGTTRPPQVRAR
ncbi:MAG TPA: hypothetical protein GYA10_17715 [Alphaproteobacteria bacterium]|nr:hypothetical protein [Alphaproteobacteria bacterium]